MLLRQALLGLDGDVYPSPKIPDLVGEVAPKEYLSVDPRVVRMDTIPSRSTWELSRSMLPCPGLPWWLVQVLGVEGMCKHNSNSQLRFRASVSYNCLEDYTSGSRTVSIWCCPPWMAKRSSEGFDHRLKSLSATVFGIQWPFYGAHHLKRHSLNSYCIGLNNVANFYWVQHI